MLTRNSYINFQRLKQQCLTTLPVLYSILIITTFFYKLDYNNILRYFLSNLEIYFLHLAISWCTDHRLQQAIVLI